MTTEVIGKSAGIVWNALNGKEPMTIGQLKYETKLMDNLLYAAIGWLACERKLEFSGDTITLR